MAALAGTFAYRFSGYAMLQTRPWWLTGLGKFQIDAKGKLTGAHRSAITPIQGQDAQLTTGEWTLNGSITLFDDASGESSILFTNVNPASQVQHLLGKFFLMVAGNVDRLWLISAETRLPDDGDRFAVESVVLEAVRVTY